MLSGKSIMRGISPAFIIMLGLAFSSTGAWAQNTVPVINQGATATLHALEGGNMQSLSLSATDPDSDQTLYWSVLTSPTLGSVNFSAASGPITFFEFTPSLGTGTESITVQVSDEIAADTIVITVTVSADSDYDSMPDAWEMAHWGNLEQNADGDYDLDGLSNLEEYYYQTDPTRSDTDGDTVNDGAEVIGESDPLDPSDFPDGMLVIWLESSHIKLGEKIKVTGRIAGIGAGETVTFSAVSPYGFNVNITATATTDTEGKFVTTLDPFVPFEASDANEVVPAWKLDADWGGNGTYSPDRSTRHFDVERAPIALLARLSDNFAPLDANQFSVSVRLATRLSQALLDAPKPYEILAGLKVVLYVLAPSSAEYELLEGYTDATGLLTFSRSDFADAGMDFDVPGEWRFGVEVLPMINFKTPASINLYDPEAPILRIVQAPGYAIIVVGKLDQDAEGMAEHAQTAEYAYRTLIARGLTHSDIYYMSEVSPSASDVVVDDTTPLQVDLMNAIQGWALDKMTAKPAPLYVILLDHGERGAFYMYSGNLDGTWKITPLELDFYLDTLQGGLPKTDTDTSVALVVGSCYAGTFLPRVSRQDRVVITSTSKTEISHRGNRNPITNIRDGEAFVTEFFRELRQGSDMRTAFQDASYRLSEMIEMFVAGYDAEIVPQHPVLDDNGDGVGTWANALSETDDDDDDDDDGALAGQMKIGYKTSATEPISWERSDQVAREYRVVKFAPGDTAVLSAATPENTVENNAWVEVKTPLFTGSTAAQSDYSEFQQMLELPLYEHDSFSGETYTWNSFEALFDTPGTYKAFFQISDAATGEIGAHMTTTVYRMKAGNQAPPSVSLRYPADSAVITTQSWFAWNPVTDPDGDRLTYRIDFASDTEFTENVISTGGIKKTFTNVDGLLDLFPYYWRVVAVDEFGAEITSGFSIRNFICDNTNASVNGNINIYVHDASTNNPISGAEVQVPGLSTSNTDSYGQIWIPDVANGTYTINVSASGYTSASDSVTLSGDTPSKSISLQPDASKGLLTVTMSPSTANTAGARWSLDGGSTWNASGVTVANLTPANCTVQYKAVSGWIAPPAESISVTAGNASALSATYVTSDGSTGSLSVTITPAAAVSAGARWAIDGGAWRNSGIIVGNLLPGAHSVTFNSVSGYTTPASKSVTITAGSLSQISTGYTASTNDDDNNGSRCGKSGQILKTSVAEQALPVSASASAPGIAVPGGNIGLRFYSDVPVDKSSVWAVIEAEGYYSEDVSWRSVSGDINDDGWVMHTLSVMARPGTLISMSAGAWTIDGTELGPAVAVFQIGPGMAGDAAIVEDTAIPPLPEILGDAVSPVYRVGPAGVFDSAAQALIPVPEDADAEGLEIFYYSESSSMAGWYSGKKVQGWIVPDSQTVIDEEGARYIQVDLNHSGVLQLALPNDMRVAGIAIKTDGAFVQWAALAASLLFVWLLSCAIVKRRRIN